MSSVTILYNRTNTFGLAKDVEGIQQALGASVNIRLADPLEPPSKCDLAIHLEIPVYGWMPWAARNVLMVNPEWFQDAWVPYMGRFDSVIYKDPLSAAEALDKGYVKESQVRIVPWGCAEPTAAATEAATKVPKGTADTGFVWFLGASVSKRAYVPTLLAQWKEQYPPLRIYSVAPVDCSGMQVPSNVRLEVRYLEPKIRSGLARFFRGHIGCSAAEGFSYPAAEAEWVGAFTLLNDLNCFNSDYAGRAGVHVVSKGENLNAAMAAFEATDFEALAVERKASAAARWSAFQKNFALSVQAVLAVRVAVPPNLPPILMPEECPPISVVTLLYNRKKFFELACHNMLTTDYPKDKIEWIIVEDSDDPAEDASDRVMAVAGAAAPLKVEYLPLKRKTPVAEKRNLGTAKATSEIILMMDDDDHYPATSFRRRVAWLTKHPWKPRAVTATTIACYDLVKGISAVNTPPMGLPLGQRISEATLTFYKSWWAERGFPSAVQVGEGEEFLSGRAHEVLEIPPQQIIVAFSHGTNTSSRRIPSGAEVKPGCFWGFPKEFLVFIHGLAGIKVVAEETKGTE